MFKIGINLKIAFPIIIVTGILLSSLLAYIFLSYRDNVKKEAYAHVESRSREMSSYYSTFFNNSIDVLSVFEKTLLSIDPNQNPDRKMVLDMCSSILESNPDFYSVWVMYEPNAFDNFDASFANNNLMHSTHTGRFVPSYNRSKSDIIPSQIETDQKIIKSEVYQLSKKNKKISILEPHYHSYTGEENDKLLETTIAIPLVRRGEFIGIVGVNISLEKLNAHNNNLKLYRTGFGKLVTDQGKLVVHPDAKKILSTSSDTKGENGKKILNIIKKQKYTAFEDFSFALNTLTFKVFSPINIHKAELNWTYVFVIPVDEILEEIKSKINETIILSAVILVFLMIIILMVSHSVTKPIRKFTQRLETLSKGQISKLDSINTTGKDEIASMLIKSNLLIDGLKQTVVFANEIGNGKLETKYEPLSNEDELGKALLNMRNSLVIAEQEHQIRQTKDAQELWSNEGFSKFTELTKTYRNDIDSLSIQLLTFIAGHIRALQAGLFIEKEDEKTSEKFLERTASYAYNKDRLLQNKILMGENILGAVALERKTTIVHNIPPNYTKIESALGESQPKTLILIPIQKDERFIGVLELALLKEIEPYQIKWLEKLSEEITIAFELIRSNIQTEQLLLQSNEQTSLLRQQEEELRQNLEELQTTQEESTIKHEHNLALIEKLKLENLMLRNKLSKVDDSNDSTY